MKFSEVADLLRGQDKVLILTHRRPDGDTLGSAAALCRMLRDLGKTAYMLKNFGTIHLFASYVEPYGAPEGFKPSFVVSVDTASLDLIQENGMGYADGIDLAIDHHPSNSRYAKKTYVDPKSASCGEVIYALARELTELTREIALPLYLAVSTDTGCFRYGNTTAQAHRVAAELMDTGIDAYAVNKAVFSTKTFKRLKLEAMLFEGLELYDGGTVAVAVLTRDMMNRVGATEDDADDLAAFARQVEGVDVGVTIRELDPGSCKISLRSSPAVNSSKVCALLGGGGHAAAGGCTVEGTVDEAKEAILKALDTVWKR
ncbi:DHH family phosphoesterase [Papillibacter cinnamivorans]|uniref:Phosphoesterase RecJ domain-containing protein n=1 Tax=Papillibacter cinnamivorans DSM 12816 TaxID=1122930 RepID=A0A1W2BJV5_9FIRM|nr:bifunctional oligoribonuclease/PAP phosphatase NrnA [Papillibacter cinnamivorans]SMC73257.1 phosphoesterase RecJ domain-containing protein [Papillibacter cinnamivorans DSM 12816]